MSNFPINAINMLSNDKSLEIIELEPEDFALATKSSDEVIGEPQQWQTYLNILAVCGFKQWLDKRLIKLPVNWQDCYAFHPNYADAMDVVSNLRIGDFNLSLIVNDNLIESAVTIPKVSIESAELAAHFYILIEVQEEEEQVIVHGFVRRDQIINYLETAKLPLSSDDTYQLPLSLFNFKSNHLLHFLHFLSPTAIALPVAKKPAAAVLIDIKQPVPLWEQVINVGLWLKDEINEFAKNQGWTMPTPLTPVSGWRSTAEFDRVIDDAIAQYRKKGMDIPLQARRSSYPFRLSNRDLAICAATWEIPPTQPQSNSSTTKESSVVSQEWSLLFILGMQSGGFLPRGIKLQIRDLNEILRECTLETDDFVLAQRFRGNIKDKDQLFVTITLNENDESIGPFVLANN